MRFSGLPGKTPSEKALDKLCWFYLGRIQRFAQNNLIYNYWQSEKFKIVGRSLFCSAIDRLHHRLSPRLETIGNEYFAKVPEYISV